jgi:hypothetical protein
MTSKKKLKLKSKIGFTILMIFLYSLGFSSIGGNAIQNEKIQTPAVNAYSTSGIVINDTNIASYSSSGTGNQNDPYIIDNLMIDTTDSLAVDFNGVSAGVYYELRDSHLIGSTYGVYIHDITNGEATIVNCTIEAALAIGGANAKYLTIRECTLKFTQAPNFRYGLTFENNEVYYVGSWSGSVMKIEDQDNIVEHNTYYGNYSYFGVSRITNSSVRFNTLNNAGFSFSTDEIEDIITNDIEGNVINGKPMGYFVNRNDEVINAEDYAQVYIVNSTNTIIEDAYADHLYLGIQIHNCTDVTVRDAYVSGHDGIEIKNSKGVQIEYSTIETFYDGIELDTVEDVKLLKNYISGAEYAIDAEIVDGLKLYNNTILNVKEFGVYISEGYDLEMKFNIITINIDSPGSEFAMYFWDVENGEIYYNVFINTGNDSESLVFGEGSTNVIWYEGTLEVGNHYSDWNETGTYTIPGDGEIDLYPFIDVDGDNLTEFTEVMIYHTNPFEADSDGDGFDDYTEIISDTDPLNPKDYPGKGRILAIVLGLIFGLGIPAGLVLFVRTTKGQELAQKFLGKIKK